MRKIVVLLPVLVTFLVGAAPASAWTWPVTGPVLQPFVLGDDPYAGGQHRGIDVAAEEGAAVVAPAGGVVTFAGSVPGGGRTVTIETADGYAVTLLHLGRITVARGAAIAEGSSVAIAGRSGEPEHHEPYVHLGIRVTADPDGYLDPLAFLPSRAGAAQPESEATATDDDAGPSGAGGNAAAEPEPTTPDDVSPPASSTGADPAAYPVPADGSEAAAPSPSATVGAEPPPPPVTAGAGEQETAAGDEPTASSAVAQAVSPASAAEGSIAASATAATLGVQSTPPTLAGAAPDATGSFARDGSRLGGGSARTGHASPDPAAVSARGSQEGMAAASSAALPREARRVQSVRPPVPAVSSPERLAGQADPAGGDVGRRVVLAGGLAAALGLAVSAAALRRRGGPSVPERRPPEAGGPPEAPRMHAPVATPQLAFVRLRSTDDLASSA
jgi:hypothetical protein